MKFIKRVQTQKEKGRIYSGSTTENIAVVGASDRKERILDLHGLRMIVIHIAYERPFY